MGAMFVDDLDLFTWKEDITDPFKLMLQAQREITKWSLLLNATGGALKPEKCFWYLLDYTCIEGEWAYEVHSDFKLYVTNPDESRSRIRQEEVSTSKKTLGICDAPSVGNQGHLEYIHSKQQAHNMNCQDVKWSSSEPYGLERLQTTIVARSPLQSWHNDKQSRSHRVNIQ